VLVSAGHGVPLEVLIGLFYTDGTQILGVLSNSHLHPPYGVHWKRDIYS
jgi:hypothetical protein